MAERGTSRNDLLAAQGNARLAILDAMRALREEVELADLSAEPPPAFRLTAAMRAAIEHADPIGPEPLRAE